MSKLFLIRGIPGSGKSTLAQKFVTSGITNVHIEADMFFVTENNQYNFNSLKIKDAHEWCQQQTRKALQQQKSVVVANTFIRKWELFPYLKMASQFNITPTILIANGQFKSIHRVPEDKILKMKQSFEF